VAAATELFAARGPSAVPIREIAERAGVNHGLVHQYFGSKAGLVTAVLDDLAEQTAAEIARHDGTAAIYAEGGATALHGRILAHLLLEGADPASLKSGFPSIEALIETYQSPERVAQVVALVLGWQLFEPFLAAAAGLDLTDDTRKQLLNDAITRLLQR
jgi:TetR/AcrR family transcriptional regulator, repressor for neighboring sulfatase